jgi:orotidine-5'-phosphate decarboxylase
MFMGLEMSFIERLQNILNEKDTILCVGLDPALPEQRKENVIPSKFYVSDEREARLNFCLEILEQVSDYCLAAKPNEQYLRGFTQKEHRVLTDEIRKKRLLSIYDCKLGDIGSSVESALFHLDRWGYDDITVNPLPGNLKEIVDRTKKYEPSLGILVLTLMSNPGAVRYMKESSLGGKPVHSVIAEGVKECGADGCVMGATGHVELGDIMLVRKIIGEDKVILFPGIGAQMGDPEKVVKAGGKNILINVGRGIIYSGNPERSAKEYMSIFNKYRV